MLDIVEPDGDFSAADYVRQAREAVREIARRGRIPLLVGGTGLYFRAFFGGLFEGPARDEPLRRRLEGMAERFGDQRLHRLLRRVDPEAASRIAPRDRVRVVRALEVLRATGRRIGEHHRDGASRLEGFDVLCVGLDPGREALRRAVEARSREMLSRGLVAETRRLVEQYGETARRPLGAIGYRQAAAHLRGELDEAGLYRELVTDTMRYAKRQMTWFRREPAVVWHADADSAFAAAVVWLESRALPPNH
jgi:tRNA dimethylallyltransferase